METFSILHFSDLHFGCYNRKCDENIAKESENFLLTFKDSIKKNIEKHNVILTIFSGDFCSTASFHGNSENKGIERQRIPEDLEAIFNLFHENEIPLVITPGNHEVNREQSAMSKRTPIFTAISKKLLEMGLIKCTKDQISYFIDDNFKVLFFSSDSTFSLTKEGNHEDANLDLNKIQEFLKKIAKEKNKDLSEYKKYLVTHHTFDNFKDPSLYHLAHMDIYDVFSGHLHHPDHIQKSIPRTGKEIHNFVAGSPLLNYKRRNETHDQKALELSYNRYKFAKNTNNTALIEFWKCRYCGHGQWASERLYDFNANGRPQDRLHVGLYTYFKPNIHDLDHVIDFSANWKDQKLYHGDKMENEIVDLLHRIRRSRGEAKILVDGKAHLSTGLLFGYHFREPTGFQIEIKQSIREDGCFKDEIWSLEGGNTDLKWDVKVDRKIFRKKEIVIIIDLTQYDISDEVKTYVKQKKIRPRKIISFSLRTPRKIKKADVPPLITEIVRILKEKNIDQSKKIHLFMAGPLGFFTLLGTQLNTFIPMDIYEWNKKNKEYYRIFKIE